MLLHFVFLFFNVLVSWLLRFPEMERKAIIVMASQKNLPTAAVIISYFDPASVGNLGLMSIPCIVFYIMQLFIDSFIANTWASKYERLAAVEAAYTVQLAQLDLAGKVAGKLGSSRGGSSSDGGAGGGGVGERIAAAVSPAPAEGSRRTPALVRPARLINSDPDDAAHLENVELTDINPLLQRS